MNRGLVVLLVVLMGLIAAALAFGEVSLSRNEWIGAVDGSNRASALVLWELRLPRALTACGAGAALGLAGVIFQTLLRNPLASPDVMGFTSGAAFGAILTFGAGGAGLGAAFGSVSGALAGGLVSAFLVAILARRKGEIQPLRLILVGIGAGAALTALAAMALTRLSLTQAADAQRWLAGSLVARDWGHVDQIVLSLVLIGLLAAGLSRSLALLELGDDLAATLGERVDRARLMLGLTGVLAAAAGVAVAGPLPFVALMAAPLARPFLAGSGIGSRMCGAALAGALITLAADLVARVGIAGVQLQVGALTGMLGGPWLLWRIARDMKEGRL